MNAAGLAHAVRPRRFVVRCARVLGSMLARPWNPPPAPSRGQQVGRSISTSPGRRPARSPGGLLGPALFASLLVALAAGCVPASRAARGDAVTIDFRYSHFTPEVVTVRAGEPVIFTLRNGDPIDHEWIVGPPEIHAVHRVGTEAVHSHRPTEVTVPALHSRTTQLTFDQPGEYAYICHLPGHEAYGMKGTLRVVAG